MKKMLILMLASASMGLVAMSNEDQIELVIANQSKEAIRGSYTLSTGVDWPLNPHTDRFTVHPGKEQTIILKPFTYKHERSGRVEFAGGDLNSRLKYVLNYRYPEQGVSPQVSLISLMGEGMYKEYEALGGVKRLRLIVGPKDKLELIDTSAQK